MKNKIKLVIADDHMLFIDGLKLLLGEETDMELINVANDGKELLEIIPRQLPDVVLLDINMPKINGLDAIRYIKQSYPAIMIIMLSTYNEDHLIDKAKQNGANGYLLKNSGKEELLLTIRLVAGGQACFPYLSPKIDNEFTAGDSFLKRFNFTRRESEILQFIKTGYTNQQIADKLFLSIYTVETHRKNIMQKLSLPNPAALMKFIIENNL
jgi:DNA-binding NarL/FixJ family response regulator